MRPEVSRSLSRDFFIPATSRSFRLPFYKKLLLVFYYILLTYLFVCNALSNTLARVASSSAVVGVPAL